MRILSITFLVLALFFVRREAVAQRYFVTNQYVYDLFLVNPSAVALKKDCYTISGYYQKQWYGMDLAPTTQMLAFQKTFQNNVGIGTYAYNDRNGYHHEIGFQQSFGYKVVLSKTRKHLSTLLFGLSGMLADRSIDMSSFGTSGALDPAIGGGSNVSGFSFNANAGIMATYNNWRLGFSATNLFPFVNPIYTSYAEPKTYIDLNVHAGTLFKLPKIDLFLEPLIFYRRNNYLDSRLDLNLKFTLPTPNPNITLWGLMAYRRSQDAQMGKSLGTAVTAGVFLGQFKVGLEYQLGLTQARSDFGNSYLLVFGYRACRDRKKDALTCPEDFKRNKRRVMH